MSSVACDAEPEYSKTILIAIQYSVAILLGPNVWRQIKEIFPLIFEYCYDAFLDAKYKEIVSIT